jgi:hypothetical protein
MPVLQAVLVVLGKLCALDTAIQRVSSHSPVATCFSATCSGGCDYGRIFDALKDASWELSAFLEAGCRAGDSSSRCPFNVSSTAGRQAVGWSLTSV